MTTRPMTTLRKLIPYTGKPKKPGCLVRHYTCYCCGRKSEGKHWLLSWQGQPCSLETLEALAGQKVAEGCIEYLSNTFPDALRLHSVGSTCFSKIQKQHTHQVVSSYGHHYLCIS